jgi:hypothetical protein
MMLPRLTIEGDSFIDTTVLEVKNPSFITSTYTITHTIADSSPIGAGRLTPEALDEGGALSGLAITVVFVGKDGTTSMDMTAFARYTAADLLFGPYSFKNVMVQGAGGVSCDFTRMNHLSQVEARSGPQSTKFNTATAAGCVEDGQWGQTEDVQNWNNMFSELCM